MKSRFPMVMAGVGLLLASTVSAETTARGNPGDNRAASMLGVCKLASAPAGASLSDAPVWVSDRYPELLVGAHALEHFVDD